MSVILALRRLRQEDGEFEVSLSYIAKPCLKKPKTKIKQTTTTKTQLVTAKAALCGHLGVLTIVVIVERLGRRH
jgi:hypothetical protein